MAKGLLQLSKWKYDPEQHWDLHNVDLMPTNDKDAHSLPLKPKRRN
jgi:hypothetical protein